MLLSDLEFDYPPELTATEPSRPTRVAFTQAGQTPRELSIGELLAGFSEHDLFVVNDTKVIRARVFSLENLEILFLKRRSSYDWEVLFPSRDLKVGATLGLPGGVEATLVSKGLPQILTLSQAITPEYFEQYGELALPPYIQEARGERHNRPTDAQWYQTDWAERAGSVAAPTASLHFTGDHLAKLGRVAHVTLHVGAGTFFPIRSQRLEGHKMHDESVEVPRATLEALNETRARGGKVWALGTTVTRTLESLEKLNKTADGGLSGETDLFIYPPYEFKNVDVLLTNFHQPRSSLLALVAAFAGLEPTRATYRWAIARGFKLFSYGDLSAWTRR